MLMRISQAAKYTSLSVPLLQDLVKDGTLPVVMIRAQRRFRQEDLDHLMQPVNMADLARLALEKRRETLAVRRRNKALRKSAKCEVQRAK